MKRIVLAIGILVGLFAPYAVGYEIVGWGWNKYGQATPPAGNDFIAIAAGYGHCLALKSDGSIVGWGANVAGQATPPAGNNFVAIAASEAWSLALKSDGSLVGWGDNSFGLATPPPGNDFVAIAAGEVFGLALKSDGSIVGWGDNSRRQLPPPAGNDFIAIAAGYDHSLALKSDGSIVGWGSNDYGCAWHPAGNSFIAIDAGWDQSLALNSDGSIDQWGLMNYYRGPPAGNSFVAITAGADHCLALKSDGSIVGWAFNNYWSEATPPAGNNFVAITAGWDCSLALRETATNRPPVADAGDNQTVYAWIAGEAKVVLDGSGSSDADGDALTYKWTWTVDANTYDANGVCPTIELPVGRHTIQLVVNDGLADSAPDDVNITVIAPMKGNLCVMPSTINRRSNEKSILATIRLPDGIGPKDIDGNEPLTMYPGSIKGKGRWIVPCNERGHRFVNVFAFFDKDDLMTAVPQNGITPIKVAGKLKSGQYFYGCDTVKIIDLKLKWPWCQW